MGQPNCTYFTWIEKYKGVIGSSQLPSTWMSDRSCALNAIEMVEFINEKASTHNRLSGCVMVGSTFYGLRPQL